MGCGVSGGVSAAVALFRSLGDPVRLAIVAQLAEGDARVVDLTRALGLAQSTVSKHLACCGTVAWWITGPRGGSRFTR